MIVVYNCESCGMEFYDAEDCLKHEEEAHNINKSMRCAKCGKEKVIQDDPYGWEQEYWHTVNLGRQGYGSRLDGCDVQFTVCDDCLYNYVKSFTLEGQEKIFNSGSNRIESTEEWIARHKKE